MLVPVRVACAIALAIALLAGPACTTVIPRHIDSSQASFDGGAQSSGVLGFTPEGTIAVTPHFRDRYNALVAVYGAEFRPPLSMDDGLRATPAGWTIDKQHFVCFETMNRWRKEGKPLCN